MKKIAALFILVCGVTYGQTKAPVKKAGWKGILHNFYSGLHSLRLRLDRLRVSSHGAMHVSLLTFHVSQNIPII
jgi:hypothetical protein